MAAEFTKHPFLQSVQEVASALGTDLDTGLSSAQVGELSQRYPPNELDVGGAIPWYTIFIRQLCNAMILVLFFAMALSFGIEDHIAGGVLAAVIVLNVSIGFYQEYGAEKKMDALRALSAPSAHVVRDGKTIVIPNSEVVPGDVVILKMGDTVPADLRVFEAMNLQCDEQSLTGEAAPVEKTTGNGILVPGTERPAQSDAEVGVGDRVNMAYATTTVRKGRGRGVVVSTGMATEVGRIAAITGDKGAARRAGRSMDWKKYGKRQAVAGGGRRLYDVVGKFLGLTEGTPLQVRLAKLAYLLFLCALILAVIVFAVNRFSGKHDVVIYAISTGIAIIPESLVAVLTITMVVATTVMRKANVVVRDLSALEALGGVTNICSDKTGTLTQGAMIVKKAWLPWSNVYTVRDSKDPSDPTVGTVTHSQSDSKPSQEEGEKGASQEAEKRDFDQERTTQAVKFDVPDEKLGQREPEAAELEAEVTPDLGMFLLSSALCNLATVRHDEAEGAWQTTGEPTEIALQVFAHRFRHYGRKPLEKAGWRQVAEFPFDSSIKRMSVVYSAPGHPQEGDEEEEKPAQELEGIIRNENSYVFTKGAVERVLDLCSHIGVGDAQQEITDELKERVLEQMSSLASLGQRVLAVAYREWEGKFDERADRDKTASEGEGEGEGEGKSESEGESDDALRARVESRLVLLGLAGIYDPPRRETTPALRECAEAGIKVHMLTGDHPETARAIAREVGIIPHNLGVLPAAVAEGCVQKATEFDGLSDAQLDGLVELPLVIARCAPETKTRMIEALRRRGAFMAMTGDGVNDAPSLSRADVGIAMGSGSDVAKSAAKIVLADDQFSSIVAAIREGRRMFDNIQKFVLHLLSSNVGEVILLIAGLGFRDESGYSVFPISPLEILWINMLTSSFPAFGLGRERAARDVMRRPPQDKARGVFTNQILADMLVYGVLMGTCTLMTFVIIIYGDHTGHLGHNCNNAFSGPCGPVFRARAAVFAELTWLILVSAWEFKDIRRSMFRLDPDGHRRSWSTARDLYDNRFLFWAVAAGAVSVFPVVYIPVLNTKVFKHSAISWEWGVVVGMTLVFIAGIEVWKLTKRSFNLLEDRAVVQGPWSQGSDDDRSRRFGKSISFGSLRSWRSWGRADSHARSNTNLSAHLTGSSNV